jgi:hypothetical protein
MLTYFLHLIECKQGTKKHVEDRFDVIYWANFNSRQYFSSLKHMPHKEFRQLIIKENGERPYLAYSNDHEFG